MMCEKQGDREREKSISLPIELDRSKKSIVSLLPNYLACKLFLASRYLLTPVGDFSEMQIILLLLSRLVQSENQPCFVYIYTKAACALLILIDFIIISGLGKREEKAKGLFYNLYKKRYIDESPIEIKKSCIIYPSIFKIIIV